MVRDGRNACIHCVYSNLSSAARLSQLCVGADKSTLSSLNGAWHPNTKHLAMHIEFSAALCIQSNQYVLSRSKCAMNNLHEDGTCTNYHPGVPATMHMTSHDLDVRVITQEIPLCWSLCVPAPPLQSSPWPRQGFRRPCSRTYS